MQFYNITDNLQTQFVLSAIAASPKVNLTGFTNELVVLTPPNVTPVPMLPKKDGVFFRLDGLRREKFQEGKMTSGSVIEFISVHHGLPDVCAACGGPIQRYGLFMAKARNSRNTRKLTISGENAQQVFEAIQNNREFIALPLCGQHSAVSLFYKEKAFYTDDARYAQMLADSGFAVTPVQQVAGAHIQPQPPQGGRRGAFQAHLEQGVDSRAGHAGSGGAGATGPVPDAGGGRAGKRPCPAGCCDGRLCPVDIHLFWRRAGRGKTHHIALQVAGQGTVAKAPGRLPGAFAWMAAIVSGVFSP